LDRLLGIVLLVLTTAAARPACNTVPANAGDGTFEFRPGILVDTDKGVCYLMNNHEGIDALNLLSGEALWTTTIAQKPLIVLETTLVAQAKPGGNAGILRLVFLDTDNDGADYRQVDIDLPEGVRAAVDDGPGTNFRVEAWATQGGFTVKWDYSAAPVRGALQDPTKVRSEVRRWEGAARVDLETGEVSPADPDKAPERPVLPEPAGWSRLEASGSLLSPLWHSGDICAAAARIGQNGSERTVLKRWRAATGDSLPDVTLFSNGYTIQYPSADFKYLLASRRTRTAPPPQSYDWLIFSMATGARIAELQQDIPAAWFFINGPLLIYDVPRRTRSVDGAQIEEPPELRALDLQTGDEQWIRPVRDTAYRGSLPPGTP